MLRSFHPVSIVVGLLLATVCFLAMGQTAITSTPLGSAVRVEYMPHPRDMVQIKQGSPYTVPAGKVFVVTALGASDHLSGGSFGGGVIRVDGVAEVICTSLQNGYNGSGVGTSIVDVPPGLAVPAGSTIEVSELVSGTSGRAWGYLAPL